MTKANYVVRSNRRKVAASRAHGLKSEDEIGSDYSSGSSLQANTDALMSSQKDEDKEASTDIIAQENTNGASSSDISGSDSDLSMEENTNGAPSSHTVFTKKNLVPEKYVLVP